MRGLVAALVALVPLVVATLPASSVATAEPGPSDPAARSSLRISPDHGYIGGQRIRFSGNIGARGVRTLTLQQYGGRPRDTWNTVNTSVTRTKPNGSFSFNYPAPSMYNMSYRLRSGNRITPPVTFWALSQEQTLWVSGEDPTDELNPGTAVAGKPFGISVDTTPNHLLKRPDTDGLRPIKGRTLTLQRRKSGTEWNTIKRTTTDAQGMGYFRGIAWGQPGEVVYRVRQENWFKNGNQIGWFPSFPTCVVVADPAAVPAEPATCEGWRKPATPEEPPVEEPPSTRPYSESYHPVDPFLPRSQEASATASARFNWTPSLFDFAWIRGESLTSKPYRGTRRQGYWVDYTDGTGRVGKHNGGLMLDSKQDNVKGKGDLGTMKATLRGNAQVYGRWETRMRVKSNENSAEDYRILVQLVPENAPNDVCRTITVASMAAHKSLVRFGASNGDKHWIGSVDISEIDDVPDGVGSIRDVAAAFGVEVGQDHLTWFLEGQPIGTVSSRAAIPRVPMTLRLAMVGRTAPDGTQTEMNHTDVISDWQRGFRLGPGKQVRKAPAMIRDEPVAGC